MIDGRLSTFELRQRRFEQGSSGGRRAEPVLEISLDPIGAAQVIGNLTALRQANESPAILKWRTPVHGGRELTTESQHEHADIIHDVWVLLWRELDMSPDEIMLTFELTASTRQVQIHCNPPGLDRLILMLGRLSKTKNPIDHDHWMTERWGGHELTDLKKGDDTILINMVNVRFGQ